MKGEVWMRRRQKPEKVRFYHFIKHTTKINEENGTSTSGWVIVSYRVNESLEEGFIKDEDLKSFINKSRYIKLSENEIAKKLLCNQLNGDAIKLCKI